MLETFAAITGWKDFDMEEALLTGERINTLRHQFNVNEGLTYDDFKLPKRAQGNPPFTDGPTAGVTVDIDLVHRDYYAALDWDMATGQPSSRVIEKLDLDGLIRKGA